MEIGTLCVCEAPSKGDDRDPKRFARRLVGETATKLRSKIENAEVLSPLEYKKATRELLRSADPQIAEEVLAGAMLRFDKVQIKSSVNTRMAGAVPLRDSEKAFSTVNIYDAKSRILLSFNVCNVGGNEVIRDVVLPSEHAQKRLTQPLEQYRDQVAAYVKANASGIGKIIEASESSRNVSAEKGSASDKLDPYRKGILRILNPSTSGNIERSAISWTSSNRYKVLKAREVPKRTGQVVNLYAADSDVSASLTIDKRNDGVVFFYDAVKQGRQ